MAEVELNVEIIQRLHVAWNRGDIPAALELIDPEIEVETTPGRPWQSTYRGYAGLTQAMEDFWGEFDERYADIKEYIPAGDQVVTSVHLVARGRSSGAMVEMRQCQVWTLRDGKVVRRRLFDTRPEALEAAGLTQATVSELGRAVAKRRS